MVADKLNCKIFHSWIAENEIFVIPDTGAAGVPTPPAADDRRERLRTTFEEVAETYDRARPVYPAELFDDLEALAGLGPGARILEVGCGTGKATLPLAERGYRITGVELGAQLAATARRKLSPFPGVEIVNADFETWQAPRADFDALLAFTSFHWLDPATRYARSSSLLGRAGMLGIVATTHVLPPEGDDFFVAVQEDYETVLPDDPLTSAGPPERPEAVTDLGDEIAASGFFRGVGVRRYLWDVVYDADEYVSVLETYSNHRALDQATRERLLGLIRRRIQARPDGRVRKTYLATLNVAQRL